ncbi:MAG TPA: glycosyltransferase, partial [Bryobacteraceae bacterium]|nr:glycosyltransferase [Bryobacteraceae bacterium]
LKLQQVQEVSVLELHRNLGHQRAIAVAMAFAAANLTADAVVVMDADGEDPPEQIPTLIEEARRTDFSSVVFAERGRRVEGLLFRAFYLLYRTLHYGLTGRKIRVGNFSVLPWKLMTSLITYPELWNHYAAAALQSRLPITMLRLDRGRRIHGESKMRFVDLVMHGLSALFAYHDLVGTRLLIANFLLTLGAAIAVIALLLTGGDWKIPLAIVIAILAGQFSTMSLLAIFLVVMNRSSYQFLPARDCIHFVRGLVSVARKDG